MRRPDFSRRVAVTGLGIISPIGNDIPTVWTNLVEGNTGLRLITRWDPEVTTCHAAGEVNDFEANDWMDFKAVRRTDRNVVFGVAAAKQAMADSGLEVTPANSEEIGVVFGSGVGGPGLMAQAIQTLTTKGAKSVSPFFIANMLPDTASGQIAIELGLKGPNMCVVTACSTGTHNIGEAAEGIRRGDFVAAITGSTETPLYEVGYIGFSNMRGMGTPRDGESLATISRPFDATRNGFVLGEGAGALVVEDLEHAKARGAKIYAEIIGGGMSSDAYHITAPHPEGLGAELCMQRALEDAHIGPDAIDYINTHGTSTPIGDPQEVKAIQRLFGDHAYNLNISATKSMTGHLLGGAGAVEGVAAIMAVHTGIVPPTINHFTDDPEIDPKLNFTFNKAQKRTVRAAMSNTFGFGGHNTAVIFRQYS